MTIFWLLFSPRCMDWLIIRSC